MDEVVKSLPKVHEALSSNSNATKKEGREGGKERGRERSKDH
jgi:hypothetical protein